MIKTVACCFSHFVFMHFLLEKKVMSVDLLPSGELEALWKETCQDLAKLVKEKIEKGELKGTGLLYTCDSLKVMLNQSPFPTGSEALKSLILVDLKEKLWDSRLQTTRERLESH